MISVVMTCYKNIDVLKIVLSQWKRVEYDDYEIILVDDGSPKDSGIEHLAMLMGCKYFYNDTGDVYSIASARNIGIWEARGDRVLFSDSDMIPHPQYLKAHESAFSDNNLTAGIRHRLYGTKDEVVDTFKIYTHIAAYESDHISLLGIVDDSHCPQVGSKNIFFTIDHRIGDKFNGHLDGTTKPWDWVWGCNFSAIREQLIGIGGFDENFDGVWGGEEQEMQYRLYLKYNINVTPVNSIGYHIPHESRYTDDTNSTKLAMTQVRSQYMNPTLPKSWKIDK
jgi:glycosyltransferase involved in cell wall biosynthesis